jgi:hypothetical protein
VIKN